MAKISVEMSYTIDYINKIISFGKIDAKLTDVDLEEDVDEQLKNFNVVMDKVSKKVAFYLKEKVDGVFSKKKAASNE